MKQATDNRTIELPMPGAKRGRGRPATGSAMTSAERQKAYRDRMRENGTGGPAGKSLYQVEAQLKNALSRIEGLEAEQALLIAERAKAFEAAEQARDELKMIDPHRGGVSELERENAQLKELMMKVQRTHDAEQMKMATRAVELVTRYDEERRRVAHLEAAEHQAKNLFESLDAERRAHQATVKNRNALQKKLDAAITELAAAKASLPVTTIVPGSSPKKRNASRKSKTPTDQI